MVRIITDSAADFEKSELEKLNIDFIPLPVTFGDKTYFENIDLTKDMFYDLVLNGNDFPKTSQPSPASFIDLFTQIKDSGDEAVAVMLSSGLSGTYSGALTAKSICEFDNLHIVDSQSAAAEQRILVEYCCKLRDEGKNAQEIADLANALIPRLKIMACLDTLEFLKRGGRISETVAVMGKFAHVKPLIEFQKGEVKIIGKPLGMHHGIKAMLKKLEAEPADTDFPVYVMYTHVRTNAEKMAEKLSENGYAISESQYVNVGAAIGTHIGPNAVGIAYVAKK